MTKLHALILTFLVQLPILSWAHPDDHWLQYSLQVGALPTSQNTVQLYQNGLVKKPLSDVISRAEKFLLIQLLVIECDASTEPFIQLIEKKAQSGTSVYLILNKSYAIFSKSCLRRLEKAQVKIQKQNTHASYWVNDQSELLIGAQSLARMFLESNGRNNQDRDLMAWAQGPVALEAILDFTSTWTEPLIDIQNFALEKRQESDPQDKTCYFLSENPSRGLNSWSNTLLYWSTHARKNIFFSGVKIDSGDNKKTQKIREALLNATERKVSVQYLGNGAAGGNGELTMVLNEWMERFPAWAGALKWIRDWDAKNRLNKHHAEYKKWPQINILEHDQFVHYKVWKFDQESLLIGSGNLADESFEKFHEAALFCRDKSLVQEWEKAQSEDISNSTPFRN